MTAPAAREAAAGMAARMVALPAPFDPAIRGAIEAALAGPEVLRLSYVDAAGRPSDREVEPAGLLTADGRWYLVAWCRTRRAGRGFRLDRIESAVPTGERVPSRDLGDLLGSAAAGAVPPAALESLVS